MREELLKKINPIIETFVDDTLKSFSNLESIRKQAIQKERQFSDLVDEKQKEIDDYKKEKVGNKRIFDEKITGLEKERQDFILKSKTYEDLADGIKNDKAEITAKLDKIKLELIIAKDKTALVDKNNEEARKLKTSYELKSKGLYNEDNRLKEKDKSYAETEKKLSIREAEIDKRQIKLNEDEQKVKNNDLKLRVKHKLVNELVAKYKLEQALKET